MIVDLESLEGSMRTTDDDDFAALDTIAYSADLQESFVNPAHEPAIVAGGNKSQTERYLILQREARRGRPINAKTGYSGRLLDVSVSLGLIILLLPVMLLVAITIKIMDPGPVLFAHCRVGKGGKEFRCYKFRTMHHGAEDSLTTLLSRDAALRQEWEQTQKLLTDPRVTRSGRFLRNTCLDELPQLFNVLFGDMALVGPRPIVKEELKRYGPYVSSYLSVRPGLTGLWQITRNEETSYRRRVATDVCYVRKRSLLLDCRILLRTIPAVLNGDGIS